MFPLTSLRLRQVGFLSREVSARDLDALESKYGVMKQRSSNNSTDQIPRNVFEEASQAWRDMVKEIYKLNKNGKNFPSIQKLVDLIEVLEAEEEGSDHGAAEPRS